METKKTDRPSCPCKKDCQNRDVFCKLSCDKYKKYEDEYFKWSKYDYVGYITENRKKTYNNAVRRKNK